MPMAKLLKREIFFTFFNFSYISGMCRAIWGFRKGRFDKIIFLLKFFGFKVIIMKFIIIQVANSHFEGCFKFFLFLCQEDLRADIKTWKLNFLKVQIIWCPKNDDGTLLNHFSALWEIQWAVIFQKYDKKLVWNWNQENLSWIDFGGKLLFFQFWGFFQFTIIYL